MDLFINTSSTLEASVSCLIWFETFCAFRLPQMTTTFSVKLNIYVIFQCRLHNCRAYQNSNCILKPRAFLGTYFLVMLIWFWKAARLHSHGQHLWLLHICQLSERGLISMGQLKSICMHVHDADALQLSHTWPDAAGERGWARCFKLKPSTLFAFCSHNHNLWVQNAKKVEKP